MVATNSSSGDYSPHESAALIFKERAIFTEQVLAGVGYGILTAIFVQLLPHFFKKHRTTAMPTSLVVYSGIMWSLGTLFLASSILTGIDLYIDDRNYPGGPLGYAQNLASTTPGTLMGHAVYILQGWLADGLMVYRCLLFFGYNYWIAALPALLLTGSFCMGTLFLAQVAHPGNNIWAHTSVQFGTPYWALSIALNFIVTMMIVSRLLFVRKQVKQALGEEHSKNYISVVSMLIESAAMTAVFSLLFLIPYARGNSVSSIFQGINCEMQIAATLLIVLRTAQGRAWSRRTVVSCDGAFTSALKFAPNSVAGGSRTAVRTNGTMNESKDYLEAGKNVPSNIHMMVSAAFDENGEKPSVEH